MSTEAEFIGRRNASDIIALAVILWNSRNWGGSPVAAPNVIVKGVITKLVIVIVVGLYEFVRGFASSAILFAVLVEAVVIVALYQASYSP